MGQLEIWKDIPGYEGMYQASTIGRIKSFKGKQERILKPGTMPTGYRNVNLEGKNFTVHQLVAMCFLGHKPNGFSKQIDHINSDKNDNRIENLQIISARENMQKLYSKKKLPLGVTEQKGRNKKYKAQIWVGKKQISLGRFYTPEEASKAYQQQLNKLK